VGTRAEGDPRADMWTLHGYILRELLKTFGLSLTGLTILFTIGGGLYNMLRSEGIGAGDVSGFLPLLLPIAITATMPIAALFSVTMVYGRLSADNELLACRSAGVNIHTTLLSAFLLSVFVTAFTLLLGGFIIPGFVQRIEDVARRNVGDFVAQHLRQNGFLHRSREDQDRMTITAERVQDVSDAALEAKGFEVAEGLRYLLTTDPVFLQIAPNGELIRFATARYAMCVFDARSEGLAVTLHVLEGQDYVIGRQMVRIQEQQFGPMRWRLPSMKRLAFAAFTDLVDWYHAPWNAPRLGDNIDRFLEAAMHYALLTRAQRRLADGGALVFSDANTACRVSCEAVQQERRALVLTRARVAVRSQSPGASVVYEAERAELTARVLMPGDPTAPRSEPILMIGDQPSQRRVEIAIQLLATPENPVLESAARSDGDRVGPPRRIETTALDFSLPPEAILPDAPSFTRANVAGADTPWPTNADLDERREALQTKTRQMRYTVIANLNFRLGISASTLVTLIMGAALGIIFRGARVLAAFALGLIPFFAVLILMVLGRQITEAPTAPNAPLGLGVIWGGLLLVALADLVILRLGVRR
jgi:lipopolysaccharide export LptBFGC system permease protein LptF